MSDVMQLKLGFLLFLVTINGGCSEIICFFVVSTGLPVMLYLFGGAFLVGGSQGANFFDNYLYSGEEIADRGNVIVVTVNYRVGTLGFLSTGDSDLPGENQKLDIIYLVAWF